MAKKPAKKAASAKPAKKVAAKKAAPKKAAAKKAPAKKAVKKAAPKKAEVKKAPVKKKAAKRVRAVKEVRLKAFWGVFNQSMRRLAIFDFNKKKDADKKAEELTKSGKSPHFVQLVKEVIEG
ncbi:MAG: hypothetical protein KF688_09185 [Pirellulales bacterium]|nr:hypothetical protein [Pirellulales bacterium]MBX3431825.1 hypothetical protein [Pirellulales bacterium]